MKVKNLKIELVGASNKIAGEFITTVDGIEVFKTKSATSSMRHASNFWSVSAKMGINVHLDTPFNNYY